MKLFRDEENFEKEHIRHGRLTVSGKMSKLFIKMIRLYQKYLSPLKSTKCPYLPTCSAYAVEAITEHGALKGSVYAAWRVLRCNPFSHGGYDPVPKRKLIVPGRVRNPEKNFSE